MRRKGKFMKVVELGLASCLSISMMAGCGGNASKPAAGTTAKATTAAATTATVSPGEALAKKYTGFVETPMDLGGRKIKFVTTVASRYQYDATDKDKTPNDTIEVIKALESIEKDYNCKFEFEQLKDKKMVEALVTAKAAGEAYCDILEFGCSDTYLEQIYSGNLVMPLDDPAISKIVGLDKNPWLKASDFGKMFGHQYGVHFKTNNTGDLLRGVVLFNKDLVEKYKLGNMYDLVKNKQWTFAKFSELCASIASQSGGTVSPLLYSQEGIFIPTLIYANGGTCAEYKDNTYKYTALSDKTLEALNFAVDLKKKGYIHKESENRKTNENNFANGEAVFFFGNYASLKKYTQGTINMENSVGLLPGPAGPSGDGKCNGVSYTEALFHVTNNTKKPEEVAAVMVAVANRTGKHDMVQTELMSTLQDEQSADMLKLMYDNMVCDFSRSISTSRTPLSTANKAMMNLEKTPKEAYEEIEPTIKAAYEALKLEK
jgi:ABC-type glycerol-3-phosphate transport system substrate-binding protein